MSKNIRDAKTSKPTKDEGHLRDHALGFPAVREDFPWGHRAFKVKNKTFLFLAVEEDGWLSLSVKLPSSGNFALLRPFAKPTGYGLGKSGWITARFRPNEQPPLDLLCEWLDESYRAIAPKHLVAKLDEGDGEPPKLKRAKSRRPGKRRS